MIIIRQFKINRKIEKMLYLKFLLCYNKGTKMLFWIASIENHSLIRSLQTFRFVNNGNKTEKQYEILKNKNFFFQNVFGQTCILPNNIGLQNFG